MVFRIEVSFKEVIGMKSWKAVALLLVIQYVAGGYVNQLHSNVQLPYYDANFQCRGRSSCPIPTTQEVDDEIERMKSIRQPYSFNGTTQHRKYGRTYNYNLYGLESPCNKTNGKYYCSILETNVCYITIRLGFEVVYGQAYTSTTIYAVGRNTIQVLGFGSVPDRPWKKITISCVGGDRCLNDEVTVLSLLYTCI